MMIKENKIIFKGVNNFSKVRQTTKMPMMKTIKNVLYCATYKFGFKKSEFFLKNKTIHGAVVAYQNKGIE